MKSIIEKRKRYNEQEGVYVTFTIQISTIKRANLWNARGRRVKKSISADSRALKNTGYKHGNKENKLHNAPNKRNQQHQI